MNGDEEKTDRNDDVGVLLIEDSDDDDEEDVYVFAILSASEFYVTYRSDERTEPQFDTCAVKSVCLPVITSHVAVSGSRELPLYQVDSANMS